LQVDLRRSCNALMLIAAIASYASNNRTTDATDTRNR
jgi:hypothetical protein